MAYHVNTATTTTTTILWPLYSTTCIRRHRHTPFTRYSRFNNRLYRVNKHPTGCQTGLTSGWMFIYMIQPVVKPVWQPVECFYTRYNRLWFDNWLYRLYKHLTDCQTGLTTGYIV